MTLVLNNMAPTHAVVVLALSATFLLVFSASATAENIPKVEAYFQGHCSYLSPCHQRCINLPRGGYECACYNGYKLHPNGFSCVEANLPFVNISDYDDPESTKSTATDTKTLLSDLEVPASPEKDDKKETKGEKGKSGDGNVVGLEDLAWDHFLQTNVHKYGSKKGEELMQGDMPVSSVSTHGESTGDDKRAAYRYYGHEGQHRGNNKYRTKSGRRRKFKMGRNRNKQLQSDADPPTYPPTSPPVPDSDRSEEASNFIFEKTTKPPVRHQSCDELRCHAGGRCVPDSLRGGVRCQCRLGQTGDYCEKDIDVRFPKFMGTGWEAFPVLRGAYKEFTITIEFRPDTQNGLLLFSGESPNAKTDFFSITLIDGFAELRFDCGTGMGQITTKNQVEMHQWNTITVHRNNWNGWIQLNDGQQAKGRSGGLYSRITFREDLYLGGYKNHSWISDRTGMAWGFVGCVRKLEINNKVYDMREGAFVGDAIQGVDVGECSEGVCDDVRCQHGGTCVADSADTHLCLCELGFEGDNCEQPIDIHVPSFTGNSYLQFLGLQQSVLSFVNIDIVLKPEVYTGLIFYNGYTTDRSGDFISLAMVNGYMEFRFDLGTGPAIIRSRQPLKLGEWHHVQATRTGRNGKLSVDGQESVSGLSKGAYTQLTLTLDLFIGGHRNYDEVARNAGVKTSFVGCIQKVVINEQPLKLTDRPIAGVNVINCDHPCRGQPCLNGGRCLPDHGNYHCSCPLGFESTNCENRKARRELREPIKVPMFSGDGYLEYVTPEIVERFRGKKIDIQMKIRASGPDGLLFWTSEDNMTTSSDYLAIGLKNGHVQFGYNLGSGEVIIVYNETKINDGRWHKIRAQRYERVGYLEIDGTEVIEGSSPGRLTQLNSRPKLFIGGTEDVVHDTMLKYTEGFVGCISDVTLATDYHIDMMAEVVRGQNILECS